jgi:hypothetical protein
LKLKKFIQIQIMIIDNYSIAIVNDIIPIIIVIQLLFIIFLSLAVIIVSLLLILKKIMTEVLNYI